MNQTLTGGVDTIVRFHDLARLNELQRAVFSLAGQQMRPLRIILVLQRFSSDAEQTVRDTLAPLLSLPDAPVLEVLRYDEAEPVDARSHLINRGLAAVRARYVGLLDYDDLLYPEAYRMVTERLEASGAAIAFASICVKQVDVYQRFLQPIAVADRFHGSKLADMFRGNFCPIHSFLLDRARINPDELRFEPTLTIEEDYEFLLRVCARFPSDFALIGTQIGEYYYKSDNSNTVAGSALLAAATKSRIDAAAAFNEGRRRLTSLSEPVQQQLGLSYYRSGLTIRAFLDEQEGSLG